MLCWPNVREKERKNKNPFYSVAYSRFFSPAFAAAAFGERYAFTRNFGNIMYTSSPHWHKEAKNIAQQSTHTRKRKRQNPSMAITCIIFFCGTFSLA
jgi:hypothetical protein